MSTAPTFSYIYEHADSFLALFPHRYDYIYASHPAPHQRPQWQTESRHPLSDRLITQSSYLYGIRFGSETQYALLDIDFSSAYHPKRDPLAFQRLLQALEPLGLVTGITCTSSDSQGLHVYFPFDNALPSWEIGSGISILLETQGFKVQPGQLEIFPNSRLYTIDRTPNLFNAHRLPLQQGSYLLSENLEPIFSSHSAFVQQWQHCQQRNTLDAKTLQRILKQKKRRHYRLSNKADKFLNDLNAEIEQGWTGQGQTNRLLGRITMRSYIFHHVMYGGEPIVGVELIKDVVETAKALPGYDIWCQHRHEIEHRATEWVSCIESSHYFAYGEQFGKYKAKGKTEEKTEPEALNWNQQQVQKTKDKITQALAQLTETEQLPEQATARFNALREFGIGGGSLYRYKELWHPLHQKNQKPQPGQKSEAEQLDCVGDASNCHSSPSLLGAVGGNSTQDNDFSGSEEQEDGTTGGNPKQVAIEEIRRKLAEAQARSQTAFQQHQQDQQTALNHQARTTQLQQMAYWLTLEDPILMAEALAWLQQQSAEKCAELLSLEGLEDQQQQLEVLVGITQQLQRLNWLSEQMKESLLSHFQKSSLAHLTAQEQQRWLKRLQALPDTG